MSTTRRDEGLPGEAATMKIPPRNRWQVLLIEYELLDSYWSQLHQRVWMSGLFLVGMSMVGFVFLAVTMDVHELESLRMIALVGTVASFLKAGWFLLIRRVFAAQRVAEYRRNEIELELGMRSSLYLTFLRRSRSFGSRHRSSMAREMSEGDEELEVGLRNFAASSAGRPWLQRFMAERFVWSVVPWFLTLAWVGLYLLKI